MFSTNVNISPIKEPEDITEKLTNSNIYCREKEREYILEFFHSNNYKTLFICGQPGTGKTSLILEIFNSNLNNIEYSFKLYLNCMSVQSIEEFYSEFFKYFNTTKNLDVLLTHFSHKKYIEMINVLKLQPNNKNLLKFLSLLNTWSEKSSENNDINNEKSNEKFKFTPIILLDEVDYLYQKNKDILFYEILNLPYLTQSNLKLMLISNNAEFDKEIFPKIENAKIKVLKYVFTPYNYTEIYEILRQKLIEINLLKNFKDDALKFISKRLANKSGDIRPALEVVKNLILANKEEFLQISSENIKIIDLREVMIKLNQKNMSFAELMTNLTVEQKIMIVALYYLMNKLKISELDEKQVNIINNNF